MTDDAKERLGSIEVEAAKLLRALRERVATEAHDPDSSCCICPVCKAIDAVKDVDPAVIAAQATSLFSAVLDALRTDVQRASERARPSKDDAERVQRITIVEDESA